MVSQGTREGVSVMSNEGKLTRKEWLDIFIATFGVSIISGIGFMSLFILLR